MPLTTRQIRVMNELRDYLPSLKKGSLASADQIKLGDLLTRPCNMEARTGVITGGTSSILIQFTAALNGAPAVATLMTNDATANSIDSAVWNGTGGLTVTVNANATGSTTVAAIVVPLTT